MRLVKYIGYHGTDKSSADNILRTNFVINYKYQGWLGTGVYFFEENIKRAIDFAKLNNKGKITEVIQAILEVPSSKVFDTTRDDHANIFHEFRNNIIKETLKRKKFNIVERNSHDFDGKVYNVIAEAGGYSLIRAKTFTQPKYEREFHIPRSRVPNAVELCLKEVKFVKSKNIVKGSQEEGLA